jgi:transposase InsO family protein
MRHRPYGELQPLPAPTRGWAHITMDFVTDLPPTKTSHGVFDSILVVVDRLTKLAHYIPTRKKLTAQGLAEIIYREIVGKHGVPESIVTDRGSLFTSDFWTALCFYLRIRRRLSTAFHPQTDGQTERQNQTLEQYLRAYTNWQQDDWGMLLLMAELSYNNAI